MNERPHGESMESKKLSVIESAKTSDIEGIINVQKENLLPTLREAGVHEANLSQKGFLIHPITLEELTKVISNPEKHILQVAKKDSEVEGYTLAYDLNEWKIIKPNWEQDIITNEEIKNIIKEEKVAYLRHIVMQQNSRGIGVRLENSLFREATRRSYKYIIGEILRSPIPNTISLEFHKKMGFKVVGEILENEMVWDLVLKDLRKK